MPNKARANKSNVPRGTSNPIQYLIDSGWTEPELAVAWKLKSQTTIRRLRLFGHVPRHRTAERMAETFGWPSAGSVIDFYAAKVNGRAA